MARPRSFALALALAGAAPAASAPAPATRLFSDTQPIRFQLRGPVSAVAATPFSSRAARPAILALTHPAAETHVILLSPRGLTRRKRETCGFPPLRVEFRARPAPTSLFERQRRLKLVTHCRNSPGFQQHVLLEYAAYRMFNLLSPAGLRARLASVDYVEESGRPVISRLGFFTEDPGDAARRNGLKEAKIGGRIPPSRLSPRDAARTALFQYMIGNLDWSMRAGPAGDTCCHNVKLLGASAAAALVPVPYDFDYSGLVNAPYAVPPEGIPVGSVRERRYRGYCIHNTEALGVAAEFRVKRGEMLAALGQVPGLDESRRRSAAAYLDGFFRDVASDEQVRNRVLRTCIT